MSTPRFHLVEALPYPRAARTGRLVDRTGDPLHGAYERPISGGTKTVLINNGTELARWPTHWSARQNTFLSDRHSFANLVHHGGLMWQVGADAERPVTRFPASEYPLAEWRGLWHDPLALQAVIDGTKPIALLSGSPTDIDRFAQDAEAARLVIAERFRFTHCDPPLIGVQVAKSGRLARDADLAALESFYRPRLQAHGALDTALRYLEGLTADEAVITDYTNPASVEDCIVTGWVFGYPPITTLSFIAGSNTAR